MSNNIKEKPLFTCIRHILLIFGGVVVLFPFFWLISSSVKSNAEIFSREMVWIPKKILWQNFIDGWRGIPPYTYTLFFKNTFIIVILQLTGTLITTTMIAFAFARINFKYRNMWFMILLSTMMLPSQVTMIPVYIMWTRLGFVNTYVPLVAWTFLGGSPFLIFLMRQFMAGIPYELDEAAICDGCSLFGVFTKIIIPLCKPALFTVVLFSFGAAYDDFMGPLIYLNSVSKFPVSLGLRLFIDNEGATNWGPILAMTLVSMIPPIIVFLIAQKNLIQGISTTGLKS